MKSRGQWSVVSGQSDPRRTDCFQHFTVHCSLSTVRSRRRRAGLSLIEVLLSMAILIMSLAAIGLLVNLGTDYESEARLQSTAARLGQAKLAETEAGVVGLTETGGAFEGSDSGWQWAMTSEPMSATLYRVTVTVSRDVRGRLFEFSIGQMILDPTVKGAAAEATRPKADTGGGMP